MFDKGNLWYQNEGSLKKAEILRLIEALPDKIDLDDLMQGLRLLRVIEMGEAAAAAGDVLAHEEVVKLTYEWRDNPPDGGSPVT
jgi:hypothetical protein